MGSQHSKPAPAPYTEEKIKLITERYTNIPDHTEDDYVELLFNEKDSSSPSRGYRKSTSMCVSKIERWQETLLQNPKNRLALVALSAADPRAVLTQRSTLIHDPHVFNLAIPFDGAAQITNQRSSGRCWIFAATNVFRVAVMKKHNLEKFELSQAYFFFWDKLEKANFFLEQILDTADEGVDSRLVQTLLSSPVGDGGQWDMIANLVEKYGILPQALYPDSFNASSSSTINQLLTTKLREDALILRKLSKSTTTTTLAQTKENMLREIHLILTLTLGPPPSPTEEFLWEFKDQDGNPREVKSTPIHFARELSSSKAVQLCGGDVNSMFSLVNDPRNPYNTLLTVDRLGNIVGGRGITYVNVSMPVLKTACIAMLKAGLPIFFGSDVGKSSSSASGIMDTDLIDYELGFNVKLGMTKAERLLVGESAMTHAMVLTAVHLDKDGKSVRWRVENSWGVDAGKEGWFVMSDKWMDEFVYQAVVEPGFVEKEIRDVLRQKAKVLPLWDPMGALA